MHRSVLSLAAAALVFAGCDSPPSAPQPASLAPSFARGGEPKDGRPDHENFRAPFARTVANPCPPVPEPVAVEGYFTFNSHFKFFEGGNSSRIKTNSHGSGIGAVTGVRYQFHELWTLHGRYTYEDSRFATEQTTRFHVISQTDLGNFFATMKTRVTCTPDGCQTEVVSVETDCRG